MLHLKCTSGPEIIITKDLRKLCNNLESRVNFHKIRQNTGIINIF